MSRFHVYAPLNEFEWEGVDFELGPGLWLRHRSQRLDLRGLDTRLAQDEQDTISSADHWLEFQWEERTAPSPAETVNAVLLAFWLVKLTKTHVAYRFELGCGSASDRNRVCRVLDRFAWVPGPTHAAMDDPDIESAAEHNRSLRDLCRARGRLNDALVLTLTGCCSHKWQAALISHAAAAEAILTYASRRGITRRLSTSYACFIEMKRVDRDRAYREFADLYSARSDIMHGRTHNVAPEDRFPMLARFEAILRRLWRTVLSSPELIQILEGTDEQRQAWFAAREEGYSPPRAYPLTHSLPLDSRRDQLSRSRRVRRRPDPSRAHLPPFSLTAAAGAPDTHSTPGIGG